MVFSMVGIKIWEAWSTEPLTQSVTVRKSLHLLVLQSYWSKIALKSRNHLKKTPTLINPFVE